MFFELRLSTKNEKISGVLKVNTKLFMEYLFFSFNMEFFYFN